MFGVNMKTRSELSYRSTVMQQPETRVNAECGRLANLNNSSRMSSLSESISTTGSIKKGVLWMQSGRIFSRWKQRYFVLTRDYLQCFKRSTGSNRISEMGKYLFKIALADIRKLEWRENRSITTIEIVLNKDDRILLRCEKNLNDWLVQLKLHRRLSNERRDSLKNQSVSLKRTSSFMSTDSSTILSLHKFSIQHEQTSPKSFSPTTITNHSKIEYPFISTMTTSSNFLVERFNHSEKRMKMPPLRLDSKCDRLRTIAPLVESNKLVRNSGIRRSNITPYTRNHNDKLVHNKQYNSVKTVTSSVTGSTTSDYSPFDNIKSHRRNYKRKTLDMMTTSTTVRQSNSHDFSENSCYRTDNPLLF